MSAVEARFYISGYERNAYNRDATTVKLQVVSRGEHNKDWAAATPTGQITMTINNASAAAWFIDKLGQEVAVRFELAPADGLYPPICHHAVVTPRATLAFMTTLAERVPVDELDARARQVRPGRVLLTIIAAIGTAIGWAIGRFFVAVGWLAGRAWLIGAFFAEAVIFGFRTGAGLSVASPSEDAAQVKAP